PNDGVVFGVTAGTATITASFEGVSGSTTVTVTSAALTGITIAPVNPTVPVFGTLFFSATANFSDGTTQPVSPFTSFTSSDPSVRIFGGRSLFASAAGTTTVTGTFQGFQDSTTVTVGSVPLTSITVTPANPSIAKGTQEQLTATCNFSDGSTEDCTSQASWVSSSNTTAVVGNETPDDGVVFGVT